MKRLVLMRHAKTAGNSPTGDMGRELLPRGIQDSQEVGVELRGLGLQYALVSSATRTRQTFAALGLDIPATFEDDLYYEGVDAMCDLIAATDESVTGLLVIGHAPTIPSLTAQLGYASNQDEAQRASGWFPTAAYSVFDFSGAWRDFDGAPEVPGLVLADVTRRA